MRHRRLLIGLVFATLTALLAFAFWPRLSGPERALESVRRGVEEGKWADFVAGGSEAMLKSTSLAPAAQAAFAEGALTHLRGAKLTRREMGPYEWYDGTPNPTPTFDARTRKRFRLIIQTRDGQAREVFLDLIRGGDREWTYNFAQLTYDLLNRTGGSDSERARAALAGFSASGLETVPLGRTNLTQRRVVAVLENRLTWKQARTGARVQH